MRRGWLIVLPFAVGLVRGSADLQIRRRSCTGPRRSSWSSRSGCPDSYVKSTVTAKMEDRLPSISNLILSRSRLERIINDFNLYPGSAPRRIMEDIVQRMRADITVKLEGQESFRVSYVSSDPQTAQKVTARLASLYIEENLRDRENLADETNLFLESQLNDAKERLIEHEKKLEAYRRRYAGSCRRSSRAICRRFRTRSCSCSRSANPSNRVRERRLLIERQIADAQTLPAAARPAGGRRRRQADAAAPLTTAQQLEAAQAQLELYKLRYTPDHPDIRCAGAHDPGSAGRGSTRKRSVPQPAPDTRSLSPAGTRAAEATPRSPGGTGRHRSPACRQPGGGGAAEAE